MKHTARDTAIFGMLGALMYASKKLMEVLPNIHLVGALIMAITLVYGVKALYPLYIYVILTGLFDGFGVWWIPYLYIWTILWGATMLLPKKLPNKLKPIIYAVVCALHGILFGTLYAPVQALMFGFDFKTTLAWIAAGFPFDLLHCVGNFFAGLLIVPVSHALRRVSRER